MVDVVHAQADERRAEDERQHVRLADGEHRRRRDEKRARERGDERHDKPH